jgi:hypothetical protein
MLPEEYQAAEHPQPAHHVSKKIITSSKYPELSLP